MSLMPRSRFTSDSARSPSVAAAATTIASSSDSIFMFSNGSTNDVTSATATRPS